MPLDLVKRQIQLLQAYYLGTPVFAIIDIAFNMNVRVSFLNELPFWKFAYYVGCFAIGCFLCFRPTLSAIFGLLESSGNMLSLLLSVMLPIYALPEQVLAGEELSLPFDGEFFANFLISGFAIVISFYRNPFMRGRNELGL